MAAGGSIRTSAIIFSGICLFIFLFYFPFAFHPHAGDWIAPYVFGYLAASQAFVWLVYFLLRNRHTRHKRLIFSVLALPAVLVGVYPVASYVYMSYREKSAAAGVRVENMQDELLHSARGNPIGVRLRFSMHAREDGKYGPLIWMYPQQGPIGELPLNMRHWDHISETVQPRLDPVKGFKRNVTYEFTVDMIPVFLVQNKDKTKYCIRTTGHSSYAPGFKKFLEKPGRAEQYRVEIHIDTYDRFGEYSDFHTIFEENTRHHYVPTQFYESALKEGAQECVPELGRSF